MNDWLPELADDDLEVLGEALESWEQKDHSSEFMGNLLDAVLLKADPIGSAELSSKKREDKLTRERDRQTRKEKSVVLRAKLLMLRDRRRVERTIRASSAAAVGQGSNAPS